jgi:hypothetical protein
MHVFYVIWLHHSWLECRFQPAISVSYSLQIILTIMFDTSDFRQIAGTHNAGGSHDVTIRRR